jgi:hypothetical protein
MSSEDRRRKGVDGVEHHGLMTRIVLVALLAVFLVGILTEFFALVAGNR